MSYAKRLFSANETLNQGDFEQAKQQYQQMLQEIGNNGQLHYNLGNTYYREGSLGHAIYHFRKAKSLLPRDADVQFNLTHARKRTKDKIADNTSVISKTVDRYYPLSLKESAYLSTGMALCTAILATILLYRKIEVVRISLRIAVGLFILTTVGTGFRYSQDGNFGVISQDKVNIYSGKSHSSVLLFSLHRGAEFVVEKKESTWLRIRLSDGKRGWVKTKDAVF